MILKTDKILCQIELLKSVKIKMLIINNKKNFFLTFTVNYDYNNSY